MKKSSVFFTLFFLSFVFLFTNTAQAAVDCDYNTCISSDITSNTTWATTTAAYVIQGTITITSGNTLTINPGVVVKFSANTSLDVTGILNASTTGASPIIFTSLKDDGADGHDSGGDGATSGTAQDWRYIKINSGGLMEIKNAIVRYAGREIGGLPGINIWNNAGTLKVSSSTVSNSGIIGIQNDGTSVTTIATSTISNTQYGVWVNGGTVSIASTTLDTNSQYGIYATGNTGTTVTVANNLFTNNSVGAAYIQPTNGLVLVNNGGNRTLSGGKRGFIFFGDITTSQTWAGDDMPYIIASGGFTIPSGKTLTINPGAIVKFESEFASIVVSGKLNAQGSYQDYIYFTSIADDDVGGDTNNNSSSAGSPGDWSEIRFNAGSVGTSTYAVVRYGGYAPGGGDANIYNNGGTLIIASSTIASSTTYGLYQASGSATTTKTAVFSNPYGMYINGGTATTSFGSFVNNTSYGMYNGSGSSINAENNYWDASDGPSGVGPGSGDAVSSNIDYDPYVIQDVYLQGYSAVNDLTDEIRYEINSQYMTAWYAATETWNDLGEINIATSTGSSTDLMVSDINNEDLAWYGNYMHFPTSVDTIQFNDYYIGGWSWPCVFPCSANQQWFIAAHELGHALGLDHIPYSGNVMVTPMPFFLPAGLGVHDIATYNYLYP